MPRIGESRWSKVDAHTVVKRDGKIDHVASVKENVKAAGKAVVDAFNPTNHFKSLNEGGSDKLAGMSLLLAPWAAIGEVADVVTAPIKVAKNVGDAVAHGAAAAADK